MKLTEDDIQEFIEITRRTHHRELTREEAREAATRVALLYERLVMPTPKEVAARLAKLREGGIVSEKPVDFPTHP